MSGNAFYRKYNTALSGATKIRIPHVKAGDTAFAGSGDWTPAAGDVKVSKDAGAEANIATLPSHSNGAWEYTLSATELSAAQVCVKIEDAALEDDFFIVETFGNASAMHEWNPDDGVRLGITALPNAAADAAGGLPISDAGGLDLDTLLGYLTGNVALASVCTESRLGELDASNLPSDIGDILSDTGSTGVAVNGISSANLGKLEDILDGTRGTLYLDQLDISSGTDPAIKVRTTSGTGVDVQATTGVAVNAQSSSNAAVSIWGNDALYGALDISNTGGPDVSLSFGTGNIDGTISGIAGTLQTLDALDTAQDSQHSSTQSAIAALNDLDAAAVLAAITDDSTKIDGSALSTAIGNINTHVDASIAAVLSDTSDIYTYVVDCYNAIAGLNDLSQSDILNDATPLDGSGLNALIGGTIKTLDALDTAQDSQHSSTQSAIAALNDLDAASVRSALGLSSANLDTQLADVPTVAEFEARTLAAASYALASVCTEGRLSELDAVNVPADVDAITSAIAALNDITAADVKTAIEADGSKLDHLWEMTEDDGGTRRLTENALEEGPAGGDGDTVDIEVNITEARST